MFSLFWFYLKPGKNLEPRNNWNNWMVKNPHLAIHFHLCAFKILRSLPVSPSHIRTGNVVSSHCSLMGWQKIALNKTHVQNNEWEKSERGVDKKIFKREKCQTRQQKNKFTFWYQGCCTSQIYPIKNAYERKLALSNNLKKYTLIMKLQLSLNKFSYISYQFKQDNARKSHL